MCETIDDIVRLIKKRDNLSIKEVVKDEEKNNITCNIIAINFYDWCG